jgi:hypothetical protein
MKRQILAAALFLLGGTEIAPLCAIEAQAQSPQIALVVNRIIQTNRPLKTLSLEWHTELIEEKHVKIDNPQGRLLARGKMDMDFEKNSCFVKTVRPIGKQKNFQITKSSSFINGRLVELIRSGKMGKGNTLEFNSDFSDSGTVSIRRHTANLMYLGFPLNYVDSAVDDESIIGKIKDFKNLGKKLALETCNGKQCLKYSTEVEDFLFDCETGFLVKKIFINNEDGRRVPGMEIEFEKYARVNGWDIPVVIVTKSHVPPWSVKRQIVDLQSLTVNRQIPPEVFLPRLPLGAEVSDQISGKNYNTYSLKNAHKEKMIAKELDRIFNETEK